MARTSVGSDLLGASRLAFDAVAGVTALVEAVHMTVLDKALGAPVLAPAVRPVAGVTRFVYRGVQSINRTLGGGVDGVARRLVPLLKGEPSWQGRDAIVAALNGVLGDRLAAHGNPLAIPMRLRPVGEATPRILVLAHGLCMNGEQWLRDGVDHGANLARERGYSAVYLDYNSGRHISESGRELAQQLEALVAAWPVPIEDIAFVTHSMGGLVARSACHYAELADHRWRPLVSRIAFLGTPHQGAPLERGGNWITLFTEVSRYSAPFARLARIRSAGITDLRHGSILDEAWQDQDRFAAGAAAAQPALVAPQGVRCLAIGATIGKRPGDLADKLLVGDGLVPLASALASGSEAGFETAIVCSTNHMQLLSSSEVGTRLLDWF